MYVELSEEGKVVYIPLGEKETAKALIAQARAELREELREEVSEEVREEGRAEVMEEAEGKIANIIKNFLANGFSPEDVARGAGVPIEQLRGMLN